MRCDGSHIGDFNRNFSDLMADNSGGTVRITDLVELIYWLATSFATRAEAQATLFRYIDGWYNPRRIQAGLGGHSPDEYEAAWQARQQQQP
ncbi:hypothetical protein MSIMFI_05424 [Mycobacterium simulans]|uniref:IS3 family transposase n=1 Tax=Mycobacterium simulans TaxID=627089 RepID=UPI001989F2A2|nr:IS3 family transposase [Mycobacterium simulans]SON63893.1 hypothetical protein MSIMFI_05424 [Mycobacterium simulans]